MRNARRCADDTGGHRLAAFEEFEVNPFRRHAEARERVFHVRHEARRPADVDIGVSRKADLVEGRPREMPGGVEILARPIVRPWTAVTDTAAAVREREYQ